jgi:hypothetical protein
VLVIVSRGALFRETASGLELDVIVSPKSDRSEVEGFDQWRGRLVVKLKAPPEKGEANKELVELLEVLLSAKVSVLRGHTSRTKTVLVTGDLERAKKRLEEWHARP